MSIAEVIQSAKAGRTRTVLWIEFAVVISFAYLASFLSQWDVHSSPPRNDPMEIPADLASIFARLLPILFIVLVADGTLSKIGFKRPNLKIDSVVFVALGVALYVIWHLPAWIVSPDLLRASNQYHHPSALTYELIGGATLLSMMPGTLAAVVFEEVLMRGYVIARLTDLLGNRWVPVLISAIMFGAWHIYQGPVYACAKLLWGLAFAFAFAKTRSLWPLMLVHFLDNTIYIYLHYWSAGYL